MPRNSLRMLARLFLGGLIAAAATLPSGRASASPYLVIPSPAVAEASAAYKYANMTADEALAELDKRKVPYKLADPIPGVVSPVRLTGKLHGVWIHSSIPESQRATSIYEVLDARLALALDDFAKILERHDIEEVVHYSLYRPNVPREDHDGKDEPAAIARATAANQAAANAAAAAAKTPGLAAKPSVVAAKPVVAVSKTAAHPGVIAAKPGAAAVKTAPATSLGAKAGKALPKAGVAAKPQGAKTSLPAAPAKALPQLPAKNAAPSHGLKHKDPLVSDKPAIEHTAAPAKPASKPANVPAPAKTISATKAVSKTPAPAPAKNAPAALPAPAKNPPATLPAPATNLPAHATSPAGSPAAHAKSTAAKAAPPARARVTTPMKGAVPAKSLATHKDAAKPAAVATAAHAPSTAASSTVVATTSAKPAAPVSRQTWAPPGTRHPAGLAIDVALLKKRDGQWISVARDFQGKIGAKTCGDGVRTADTPEGRELRSLVCEANDLGVFTYVLTPNFNAAHYDHFHMEIKPAVKWFLYH